MTILVTGSTDGIGKSTAKGLARHGHSLLIHGKNLEKGLVVVDEIEREAENPEIDLLIADLSSLQQIRDLATTVRNRHSRLKVLINNAAVYIPERVITEDGIEMTFAVNVVAPFLLTRLLLPLLEAGAPSRIINVASIAHYDVNKVDWENLQGEKTYDGWQAYALSKLANILLTYGMARRLDPEQITVNCLHPGATCTKLFYKAFPGYPCHPPEVGALTPIFLATSPEVSNVSGKYFDDMKITRSSSLSQRRDVQERFWEVIEGIVEAR